MTDMMTLPDGAVAAHDDSDFDAATQSQKYLPRLKLMTAASKQCKDGDFPINMFALIRDQDHQEVGASLDGFVCAWRPKALDMSGSEVITVYDLKKDSDGKPTGEYLRIQLKSEEKDSMCMVGPEFLVWIPEVGVFATYFMGSKTARRESKNVKGRMHMAVTLTSQKIETKSGYTYFSDKCTACSQPLTEPDQDKFAEVLKDFNNPQVEEVERVEEDDSKESPKRAR